MARFHALLIAAAIGAVVGSAMRPSLLEIVLAAIALGIACPAIARRMRRRTSPVS